MWPVRKQIRTDRVASAIRSHPIFRVTTQRPLSIEPHMKFTRSSYHTVLIVMALISILGHDINIIAQTAKVLPATKKTSTSACSGAWTGTITYTRTQSLTDSKTVERVSARGQDERRFEMRYNYTAQVSVVESPDRKGTSVGKGKIDHEFSSTDTTKAIEKNSCDRGKTWRDMTGSFSSETKTSATADVDANVIVGINADGTYTVSVGLPQIQGQTTGSQTSSFSGQCVPKEGKNLTMPPTPTTVEGNSLTSDGSHRIDPSDPNRISGSYSNTFQNVAETITWSLQKCGAPLRFTNLQFEDMKFPNWNDWQAISEQKGTIDGNLVKIKAKVLNASGETKFADVKLKETYKGDKWDGARPDSPLKDLETSIRIEAGEQREVEFVWDSSGFAWFDDGRPRLLQRIKAELVENGKKVDDMTKNLKVAPKPLVLVHGLWSNWKAWESWQNILTTSHSYDWKAFPVGEKPEKGIMNTGGAFLSTDKTKSIFENSQQLGKYIRYAQEDRNAWHVDIVAHSMGGLISRHYIHHFMSTTQDGRPQVNKLIMLGTPNLGSPCADVMNTTFEFLGKEVEAVRQLRQDVAADFNRVTTNRKGVKFSVLAGDPLPVMCKTYVWNDGVVPVASAKWTIADNATSKNVHTELTGTADFSNFVKPRLAAGPKGDHNPAAPEAPANSSSAFYSTPGRVYGSSTRPAWSSSSFEFGTSEAESITAPAFADQFAKAVKLKGKETLEIDVPVAAVANFGITFMAQPTVSALLKNEKGIVVAKNLTGTPDAKSWFRSLFVDSGVNAGTWKLRLENTSDVATEVILTAWADAVK
jgi:triacylglycerol esterase/lipase EstA (alpha/beta hydrolase family)